MCEKCNQSGLKHEFEMMLQENEAENTSYGEYEEMVRRTGKHPFLGRGHQVDIEDKEVGTSANSRSGYHPVLGKGRRIPLNRELNSEYEIVGTDERARVNGTKDVPFRFICHLDLQFPDPDDPTALIGFGGSGVLISPRHILTAGHCLYSSIEGSSGNYGNREVAKVIATPGRNGDTGQPFGTASSVKVQYHSIWRSSRNYKFDFGIITLDKPIGSQVFASLGGKPLGYWGSATNGSGTRISPRERSSLQGRHLNISGYPGDKPWGEQWRGYGKVTTANPSAGSELIYYDIDTCGGHSGAPVWLRWQNIRNLIAIHTGPCIIGSDCSKVAGGNSCFPGDPNSSRYTANRGVLITDAMLSQIKSWMAAS